MKNKINLPLMETVYRSFFFVLHNINVVAKICSVFLILWLIEIATNLPSLCSADDNFCRTDITSNFIAVLQYLAATIVSVSMIRYTILKEEPKWFHLRFGINNLKFIGYNMLIALMIIIPSALMIMIGGATQYAGSSIFITKLLTSVGIATFIGLCVYCFRLYLVFAGAALNDKNMSLSKSYALTSGNMLKIFIGQVILVIPTIIIATIVYKIYNTLELGYLGKSVFVLLGMALSFFDSAIKASYYSHMYQYFVYFDNKQQSTTIQQETSNKLNKKEGSKKEKVASKSTAKKKTATKTVTKKKTSSKTTTTNKETKKVAVKKTSLKKKTQPKKIK